MQSSPRPNARFDEAARRRERLAWTLGGAAVATAASLLLGPALASQQTEAVRPIPMGAGGTAADSNGRMIAVTGVDITGQSVLYLVDTELEQLCAYQAAGGAPGTQSLKLIGARNIEFDLQLNGFNDKTELNGRPLTYDDLSQRFDAEVDEGTDAGR